MKKEIFVIVSGEYSDWSINSFVETEEEALKVCMTLNEKENGDDEYYYIKVNKFNMSNLSKNKPYYEYEICAYHNKDCDSWEFNISEIVCVNKSKTYSNIEKIQEYDFDYIAINLYLDTLNNDKALKIAQDMLYKKLAEENKKGIKCYAKRTN